jgi:hypothetical protein
MNLVLGDVVETIYVVDEEDEEEDIKVSRYGAFSLRCLSHAYINHRPSPKSPKCYLYEVSRPPLPG